MRMFSYVALWTAIISSGCTMTSNDQLEANKNIVIRLHREIFSEGKVDKVDEFYTADFVCHFLVGPEWEGPSGVRKHVENHRRAFRDWREEVEDIVAEGDRVVTRFINYGTHRDEFMGIPATNRQVVVREVAVYWIANGKIAEQWGFPDISGFRQQLLEGSSSVDED